MGRPVKFEAFMAHMKADRTPIEDVGRIAAEAGVKTLVLSHLTPAIDSITDDTWRAPAAKYFKGEIIVGRTQWWFERSGTHVGFELLADIC